MTAVDVGPDSERASEADASAAGVSAESDNVAPVARAPGRSATLLWVVSGCRFTEAIAIGMLIPILPKFLEGLETPTINAAMTRLATWLEWWPSLADAVSASLPLGPQQLTAILFGSTGFAMAGIQIFAARFSDRFDVRKPLILIGMLGGCACSAMLAYLSTYLGLLTTRIAQGVCMGLTFPPLMAIVARVAPEGSGGRTLGMYTSVRLLGFASGPLVGAFVTDRWDLRTAFLASAVLLGTSIVMIALWVPDPRQHPERRRTASLPISALPRVAIQFRLLGAAIFIMMVGISGIISMFPYYDHEFGATEQQLGWVVSSFIGTRFLLQAPLGALGDRFDKKLVLVIALLLLAPMVALQGYVASIEQLILVRVLLGSLVAAISSCVTGIAAERSEDGNRARVMGINTFSFSLGVAFGPLLSGFVADPRLAFRVPGLLTLGTASLVAFFVPRDRDYWSQRETAKPSAAT